MGALDDLLAAAGDVEEEAPRWLVIEVDGAGRAWHPLPLPGAMSPRAWLRELTSSAGPGWATRARWSLVRVQPRSGLPILGAVWRPVATA